MALITVKLANCPTNLFYLKKNSRKISSILGFSPFSGYSNAILKSVIQKLLVGYSQVSLTSQSVPCSSLICCSMRSIFQVSHLASWSGLVCQICPIKEFPSGQILLRSFVLQGIIQTRRRHFLPLPQPWKLAYHMRNGKN